MVRKRTVVTVGDDAEEDEDQPLFVDYEPHPLFPLDRTQKNQRGFEVSFIQITRFEEGIQKWGPCVPASELHSENDILERYGGGRYVLVARMASKAGLPSDITKHHRLDLPGLPKPLSSDPTPAELRMASPKQEHVSNGQVAPAPTPSLDPMTFLTLMLEKERIASEKAAAQQNQFMQMFMTVMTGSKTDSQNMMQMMMTMSAQQQQNMLQFITAMMANRGGGPEEFAKYSEIFRALGGNNGNGGEKKEENSIGGMLENVADILQGVAILKGAVPPSGAPPQMPAGEGPPMGGASSLLRGGR